MKTLKILGLSLIAASMIACSENPKTTENTTPAADTTQKAQTCSFELIKDSTRVSWTAYKFTEKVGVNGKFDGFMIEGTTSAENPADILKSLSMKVLVSSLNSGNPERDAKIKKEFFGTMSSSDTLSGKITEVGTDSLTINFKMNGVEKDIKAAYKITDTEISLISLIDINAWNAAKSLSALNKVCKDLHKGTDGKSVLHPNVQLSISTALNKVCQ